MPHAGQLPRSLSARNLADAFDRTLETVGSARAFPAVVWKLIPDPRSEARRRTEALSPRADQLSTDILILGAGGAGLMAALHAHWQDPALDITLVVKGMLGKSGCTRMEQGGYNVVLNEK